MKFNGDDMLTSKEVQSLLGISRETWCRINRRGEGIPYYQIGKRKCFKRSDVAAWIESKRNDPQKVASNSAERP